MLDTTSRAAQWAFYIVAAPFWVVILLAWALLAALFTFFEVVANGVEESLSYIQE